MSRGLGVAVERFKRKLIQGLYDRFTESERAGFHRFYKDVASIPEKHLDSMYALCERTLIHRGEKP